MAILVVLELNENRSPRADAEKVLDRPLGKRLAEMSRGNKRHFLERNHPASSWTVM